MKYEQTVQVELQEYICMVKRIDGVVAQKLLEQELIRCKDCKWYSANAGYHWGRCENYRPYPFDETDYCSRAERKEE